MRPRKNGDGPRLTSVLENSVEEGRISRSAEEGEKGLPGDAKDYGN